MASVKEFVFAVGGEKVESIVYAYSVDQAKRLLREALNVSRLPRGTILVSSNATDKVADTDALSLQWEKEEVALAKKVKKDLKVSGKVITVFLFTLKDGTVIEIVETAETRAKAILREKMGVARLPSGITSQKVEKEVPLRKLEREIENKKAA